MMINIEQALSELEPTILWVERDLEHNRPDLKEDLLQVGRLSAIQALSTYKPERESSLATWVALYARRDMLRYLKKEIGIFLDIDELVDEDGVDELLDTTIEQVMEQSAEIERLLSKLTEWEQFVVIEHLFNDKSFQVIAEENCYSKQYVAQTWQNSIKYMRNLFS